MTTQTESPSLSLGEQLRQAREALNLTFEDVSKEIALRPSILQLIENNEFSQKNIPAAFMKGYVRSYARFLRLPDQLWENQSFGESTKNDLGKNTRSTKAVNQYSSHSRWVGYFSALVLLIVVGMTALWWWENYRQSNIERDNLVQNYVPQNETQDSSNTAKTSLSSSASVEIPLTPPAEQTQDLATNAPSSTTSPSEVVPTLMNANSETTPLVQTPSSTTNEQTMRENAMATTEILPTENTASVESQPLEEPTISPSPSAVQGDLVIEITAASSWISIKDKNRKVLAQKEYKKGEILTFNGDEYTLIIGAPANVKITYKGEIFPLKVDGRIAKFKLPKSE